MDLADAIEIDVVDFVHSIQNLGHLPAHVAERAPESLLLPLPRRIAADELRAAHEQYQSLVVAQRHARDLTPGHGVRDIRQLVAARIARDAKGSDVAAQGSSRTAPPGRTPARRTCECSPSAPTTRSKRSFRPSERVATTPVAVLLDRRDTHAEMRRNTVAGAEERGRQVGPCEADEAPVRAARASASRPAPPPRDHRRRPCASAPSSSSVRAASGRSPMRSAIS